MSRWPMVAIGEVADPVDRSEAPLPGVAYRQIGVRLWGEGAYERESIDGAETKYKTLNRVVADDIIVNKIWARNGSVSVVTQNLEGCFCSGEFPLFRPRPERLDPQWFYWITKTRWFWEACDCQSRGTSGKNRLRPQRFLEIAIPLAPIEEQRRVVEKLNRLATSVGAAARAHEAAHRWSGSLLSRSASLVFDAALTRASIPIRDVVVFERGRFTPRPRNDPRFFGGQHPWIQIGEIEAADKYIHGWTRTLNDQGLAVSRKFPAGTVLISIAATIGSVGILGFDCCVPDSVVAAMPTSDVDSEFVYYYLSYLRGHLEELAPQSAQKNINLRILQGLPFPRVPRGEQRRIVDFLDRIRTQYSAIARFQAQRTALVNALMPASVARELI